MSSSRKIVRFTNWKSQRRNKDDGVDITLATYKTSVDNSLLWLKWKRGYIVKDIFDEITDEDIKQ